MSGKVSGRTRISPIQQAVLGYLEGRGRREFRLSDIVKATALDRKKLLRVLYRLCKSGVLLQLDKGTVRRGYREPGPSKLDPLFKLTGEWKAPRRANTCRDRIWRTMRIHRRCTKFELARLTSCSKASVDNYLSLLVHHGYVRVIGKSGREKVFSLVRDVGFTRPDTPEIGNAKGR